ncbi:MAG: helix-turn-helix transcriptional regulator [Cyclobacteriaceae bacterium]|nr:helix-turn-helix transcriptional regulator [Cyclobacteriaceae bacterium]
MDLSKEEFEKYFSSCPVTATMNKIGGKWKAIILTRIKMGVNRFGHLQRSIPTISKQILTTQLRELEEDKLISRKVFAEVPPRVEYSITKMGEGVFPILEAMAAWGKSQLN